MVGILDYISEDLKLDKTYLDNLINNSEKYYREYEIKKANGGKRRISHPSPEIKTLQYWCAENIFSLLPISDVAFAYRKGFSIKNHAEFHADSRFILHLDIKNFFESITASHIHKLIYQNKDLFEKMEFDILSSVDTINKICLKNGRVSIGSVSSPIISNVVLNDFDNAIVPYCNSHGLKYSRYADDMYVSSSKYIDSSVIEMFGAELKKRSFEINYSKTRFMSQKRRKTVTGLIITCEKKVTVGLELRRRIKSMVYKKITKDEGNSDVIMGYLSFLKDIEPLSYNRIIIKYSKYGNVLEKILS